MTLTKIVSGGQTGVDRGALDAALAAGFPCGGWCQTGSKTAVTMDLLTFVGLGVVGATLLYFCLRPGVKLPEEKGLTPLFTERCSASTSAGIGFRFGTNMPTCRITLYEHGMVIGIGKPI